MNDAEYEREWVDRLEMEASELSEKLGKLSDFLDGDSVRLLLPVEILSLKLQQHYMRAYLSVLQERLERANEQ